MQRPNHGHDKEPIGFLAPPKKLDPALYAQNPVLQRAAAAKRLKEAEDAKRHLEATKRARALRGGQGER